RRDDTVFSEYLDLIALEGYADAVLGCTAQWLAEHNYWSDLALTYVKPDSLVLRLARTYLPRHALVREIEPVQSQGIRLELGFEPYLRQLKSGARRKLSNQRQKLVSPELTVVRGEEVEPTVRLMLQLALPRFGVKNDAFT